RRRVRASHPIASARLATPTAPAANRVRAVPWRARSRANTHAVETSAAASRRPEGRSAAAHLSASTLSGSTKGERTGKPQDPAGLDDAFGAGRGTGSGGQPGKEVGKPLGNAVGKPLGSEVGKPGGSEKPLGNAVGNVNGGGPASAPSCGAGLNVGTGVGAGLGVVGAGAAWGGTSVGTAVGDAGGGLALAPVGSEATDGAAGGEPVESGSGGDELNASVPVPTRIPTTLAPSNSERPTSAGMDTPCRRAGLYVNPTGGAPIAPPAVAAPAYATGASAVARGTALSVSTWGSTSGAPGIMATASVLRKGVATWAPSAAAIATVLDGCPGASDGRALVCGRLPRTAPSSARRISVAVANRISGRAAMARCTCPAMSRGVSGAACTSGTTSPRSTLSAMTRASAPLSPSTGRAPAIIS